MIEKTLLIFILQIFFTILLVTSSKIEKLDFIFDKNFTKTQSFHHRPVLKIGGSILFLSLFLFFFNYQVMLNQKILIFSFLLCLVGFIGDFKNSFSVSLRFFFLFLVVLASIIFFDIKIQNTQFLFLNNILNQNKFLMIIFVTISFLFIINGANFIDGFNGLLLIHFIILLFFFNFLNYKFLNDQNVFFVSSFLIISSFCLLFFIFPNAVIFLGDHGSYMIGAIISLIAIEISNQNPYISPFLIASLLFYIFFEVFFSFFRKILLKKNPFLPDRLHLHMLLYKFLNKKKIKKNTSNYLTSITINSVYVILMFPVFFFIDNYFFFKFYFFILLLIYVLIYNFLYFNLYKN